MIIKPVTRPLTNTVRISMTGHRTLTLRFILLMVVIGIVPLLPAPSQPSPEPLLIRVGAYENHPKIYSDKAGKFMGIFPELLSYVAQQEGWNLEYVPGNWSECLDRLERNEIDIMVDVAVSDERSEKYDFHDETVLINWGTVYTIPEFEVNSLLDLQDKKIAVMKGSIHTSGPGGIRALTDRFDIDCSFLGVAGYREVFELLHEKKVDAGVVNRLYGTLFGKDYNVRKTPIVFNPSRIKFAFPKDSRRGKELAERIDHHLRELKNTPGSVYHRAMDLYLSGLPDGYTAADVKVGSVRKISLTDRERNWIERHPVIRLGIDPEFAPFEYFDKEGNYRGISSDYVKILNERLGLKMEVIPGLSWPEVIEKARAKEVDVLPCVGRTGERRHFLDYSRPYVDFHRVIITQTDAPFIGGMADLAGKKVAVQVNSSHQGYLKDHTTIVPRLYDTLQEALTAVSNGQADVIIGNLASATYWIRKLNLTNLKVAAPVTDAHQSLYFAVRDDWPELVAIINKGLASISAKEKNTIHRRWVSIDYTPGIPHRVLWKYILRVGGIVLLILALILIWNYKLKKEINRREKAEIELQKARDELEARVEERTRELTASNINLTDEIRDRKRTHKALTESEEKYRNVVERANDGICILQDGLIKFSNPRATDILGYRVNELLGTPFTNYLAPSEVPIVMDQYRRRMNGQEVPPVYETVLLHKGGRSLNVEINAGTILYEEKLADLVIVRDITERKRAGEELERYREHLEELVRERTKELEIAKAAAESADRLKSAFLATMSHELRTPLNSIIGFTGIILQELPGPLNAEQHKQLDMVRGSSRHLLALINDVLDISKIEAGQLKLVAAEFDLPEAIKEAVQSVKPLAEKKGLRLFCRVAPEVGVIVSDRRRVGQVLINLINNAVKFTKAGEVEVKCCLRGGDVMFSVRDTGIGIKSGDISKLFKTFQQLDTGLTREVEGTGLGLSICRKLVEMFGGEIYAESRWGEGSTFTFTIPNREDGSDETKSTDN
jgi:PAS domain S-box-containing protein